MSTEIQLFGCNPTAFYLSRKLSVSSLGNLAFRKELPEAFPGYEIKPKQDGLLALTLVERGEVMHARNVNKQIGHTAVRDLIPRILQPAPETANEQIELKITDVCYLGHRLGKRSLALLVDDPGGILQTERELYTKRFSKEIYWKGFEFHLSIAKLDYMDTIDDILSWVEQRCPESIKVEPVSASEITHHGRALVS
ncbi:MAG TPA: hypothetical protein VMR51_01230 [Patescibacteria group bacterium]|nr:hypothetical protein [Patescibacteria group bacterium]